METSSSAVRIEFAQVQMVTLYVGEDKIAFHVHEDTLFNASPVFRKAFTSDFQEGSQRTMNLPEDDAGSFGHLIKCIYSERFNMDMLKDAKSDNDKEIQAAELFALAEKYDMGTVKLNIGIGLHAHAIAKRYEGKYGSLRITLPERLAVEIAYNRTPRDSILRTVFVDWCSVCEMRADRTLRDWLPTIPEFASDLVVTTSREMQYFMEDQKDYIVRLTGKKNALL